MEAPVSTQARVIVVGVLALAGCVLPSTRRIHAEHMAKAQEFKATFDRDVKPGATFSQVLLYLKAHDLHLDSDVPPFEGRGELTVEMFTEKSPLWYCGTGSVGLLLRFRENKLTQAEASSWSFDCP
jgi:hypothetical protein